MKKFLIILVGCLILNGFQKAPVTEVTGVDQAPAPSVSESVAAESAIPAPKSFLETHSEQELEYLFLMISTAARPNIPNATDPFPYYGFKNTSKMSSNGLFNFFLSFYDQYEAETYWEESDQRFHVPLVFVEKTLDKYFAGYTFVPEEMTFGFEYQPEKQVFIMPGLAGFDGRKTEVAIKKTEVTANGDIYIEAKSLAFDVYPPQETDTTEILILHPTAEGFQFVSYQIIPASKVFVSPADSVIDEAKIEKVLNALLTGGWLGSSWSGYDVKNDVLENNFELTTFYCMMNPGVAYPDKIPASEYELFIQRYFDLSTDFLHETVDYDSESDTYAVSADISVDMLNEQARDYLRIDTIEKDKNAIKVSYRIVFGERSGSGDGTDSVFEGYVRLMGNGDYYHILSVIVTEDNASKYEKPNPPFNTPVTG